MAKPRYALRPLEQLQTRRQEQAQSHAAACQRAVLEAEQRVQAARERLASHEQQLRPGGIGQRLSGLQLRRQGDFARRLAIERRGLQALVANAQDQLERARREQRDAQAALLDTHARSSALKGHRERYEAALRKRREAEEQDEAEDALRAR